MPAKAGIILATLIGVATVANLNLAVANVALPDIGRHFDASQTAINAVAVGFSLGLAATVLWLGALGDRYGRRMMLLLGMGLSVPACVIAGFAPSIGVLIFARVLGGVAAGMAFPTTLALITALWAGSHRTKAIALWSGIGGAMSALGRGWRGTWRETRRNGPEAMGEGSFGGLRPIETCFATSFYVSTGTGSLGYLVKGFSYGSQICSRNVRCYGGCVGWCCYVNTSWCGG